MRATFLLSRNSKRLPIHFFIDFIISSPSERHRFVACVRNCPFTRTAGEVWKALRKAFPKRLDHCNLKPTDDVISKREGEQGLGVYTTTRPQLHIEHFFIGADPSHLLVRFILHTKRNVVSLGAACGWRKKVEAKLAHRVDLGTLSPVSFPRQGYHAVVSSNSFNCKQADQSIFQTTRNSLRRPEKSSSEHGPNLTVVIIASIAYAH